MPTAEKIFLALVIMSIFLGIYFVLCIVKKISQNAEIKRKVAQDPIAKNLPVFIKHNLSNINSTLDKNRWNSVIPLVAEEMKLMGINPKTLTRDETRLLLNRIIEKYHSKGKKFSYVDEKYGKDIIDLVYAKLQISFEAGPEYEKLQKQIQKKLKNISKTEIREYAAKKHSGAVSDEMIDNMHQSFHRNAMENMTRDMELQMQQDMQNQMMMQMQMDMQNQMMMQMQMDMQNQMMMQMQQDMQNQMMTQMQNDMQMQNQMMADSMHQAQMATTPMHDGGHMLDMNNMHMGGM